MAECPTVIGADQRAGMAAFLEADLHAAMGAAIVEHVELAISVAGNNALARAHAAADPVAGLGDLAFMADKYPDPAEDAIHFKIENIRVRIDPPMHPRRLHQFFNAVHIHIRQSRRFPFPASISIQP